MRHIFALLLISFHAFSQQYSFKNYTVAHGLGSSSVNHIFQDSKGYIWFATQGGGVSRFNGKEFKNFTTADGLINNDVTYVTEDRNGNIWVATAGGASQFNGSNFRNFSQGEGLTSGVIFAIHADERNKIWFASKDAGVKIFDGARFDSLTTVDGLPSCEVYCIAQDKAGSYWFGLSNGIAKYDNHQVESYADSIHVSGNAYFSAFADSDTVWFGAIGAGLLAVSKEGKMTGLQLPAHLQNDFIGGITRDQRGNFWFATDHGLLKYDGISFQLFGEKEGMSVNLAQTVLCDYEGNIWCGTLDGGVNLLFSEAFIHYNDQDGLASRNVTSILPAGNSGTYYIGTGDGLYVFNPASKPPFRKAGGIPDIEKSRIISLSMDKKDFLWICTQDGVYILSQQGTVFRLHRKYEQIAGERLVSPTKIIHDSKGNCWVTTYGSGIFLINRQAEVCYNIKTGFQSDKALTVFEDSRSVLWFGTQDAGLLKFDGKTFQSALLRADAGDQSAWCIAEDSHGNIYCGTGESGLFRNNEEGTVLYSLGVELGSNYITSLLWSERENCLWVGSEKGLEKIALNSESQIEKIHIYREQDGFISTGINLNAISIDEQGQVWLGTVNGLWIYNPKNDFPKSVLPKIQLTGIRLFYQNQDWKKYAGSVDNQTHHPLGLTLPHNKNHLTFDIQALTTQEALYTFILEGQDETWSAPTRNNEITFSNISPGDYTFKAKALNSAGESDKTVLFSFTVRPPWWQTLWFRVLIIIAVIGALVAFIKAREKVLRDQNVRLEATVKQRTLEIAHQKEVVEKTLVEKEGLLHEKEVLLKEIHHRVKNNLQTISSMLMLQSAGLKDEQAKKAIAESQSRVRSIALVHQKLYQTDGLEKVEFNAFVNELAEQVKSLYRSQSKNVSVSAKIPETYILIDTAIPLGLILNELITNSFKYAFNNSSHGEIALELSEAGKAADARPKSKRVKLVYRDSGPGLQSADAIENAATLGLRLIRLLSQQIGASMNYSNSNGSEFIFTFDVSA